MPIFSEFLLLIFFVWLLMQVWQLNATLMNVFNLLRRVKVKDVRTTKPISTISFNSPSFLALKLDELYKAGRISFWAFCVHKPEDDEGGKKQHIHVFVVPSKMLQTDELKNELKEFDPSLPDKPLGCISWISSKFDPWYLYVLHDKRYLASKGQSRRFHYSDDDIVSSDYDDLLYKIRSVDMLSLSPYADMEIAISEGLSFEDYFHRGTIPIMQVKLFQNAWDLMVSYHVNRNGRVGHLNNFDEETGEIYEDT